MTEDKIRLRQEYFGSGLDYHITGRFAVIAGLNPVAGNIFHHAIEFYLKGALCKVLDESERRKLGHNLTKIWKRFKAEYPDAAFDQFDRTISDLDQFERIRYPEEIIGRGMRSTIGFVRNPPPSSSAPRRPEPTYELAVDELDALAKVIFDKAGVNSKALTGGLRTEANTHLRNQNKTPIW